MHGCCSVLGQIHFVKKKKRMAKIAGAKKYSKVQSNCNSGNCPNLGYHERAENCSLLLKYIISFNRYMWQLLGFPLQIPKHFWLAMVLFPFPLWGDSSQWKCNSKQSCTLLRLLNSSYTEVPQFRLALLTAGLVNCLLLHSTNWKEPYQQHPCAIHTAGVHKCTSEPFQNFLDGVPLFAVDSQLHIPRYKA